MATPKIIKLVSLQEEIENARKFNKIVSQAILKFPYDPLRSWKYLNENSTTYVDFINGISSNLEDLHK